jgi:hypothetical protein
MHKYAGWGVLACNLNTQRTEAGGSGIRGHPGLHSETPFLKNTV